MKILATFDARDYEGTTGIYEKYSIRAIIVRDGRLAMQCSREGEYKIPGGGQEPGENYEQTLIREVKEETGLYVRPESICELGEIIELHRDIFEPDKKFICHSLFFYCDVLDRQAPLSLTPSEIAKGYQLKWATPEEVYHRNILIEKDSWIIRDTAFVKMLMDGSVCPGEIVYKGRDSYEIKAKTKIGTQQDYIHPWTYHPWAFECTDAAWICGCNSG